MIKLNNFKITVVLIILLLSNLLYSQKNINSDNVPLSKQTSFYGYSLKGNVKLVKTRYVSIKESLTKTIKQSSMISNDARNNNYLEFYENGLIKTYYGNIPLFEFEKIDSLKLEIIQYDNKDILQKSKYKPLINKPNRFLPDQLFGAFNMYIYSYEFGPIIYGKEHLGISQFNYIYKTDKNNRISESFEYWPYDENRDTLRIKEIRDKDLAWRIKYLFNDKNQLISQKIIPGDNALGKNTGYGDIDGMVVPYHALGTESDFPPDLQLKYKYDSKGRVIQAIFWGNNEIIASQDFEYHSIKGYVQKVKCYVTGPGEIANPTNRYIKTFNENGDIIEKEFILNFPEQMISPMKKFYEYNYDSHNNWIKCSMFLEGTKEGEPTLTAERKIEYYK